MSEFLKQFNEEKFLVLTGKSFQTLIIRCVKKGDLALMVHCGLNNSKVIVTKLQMTTSIVEIDSKATDLGVVGLFDSQLSM